MSIQGTGDNTRITRKQGLLDRAWQVPLRLVAGAFILNAGLAKSGADEQTATHLHGFASGTYPFLLKVEPKQFAQALSGVEVTVGSALLAPLVPSRVAGAVLTAFASGLVGLYLRTPGMREPGGVRPTEQGTSLAKDAWLLAIGTALVLGKRTKRL